jgi:hypothetical protein
MQGFAGSKLAWLLLLACVLGYDVCVTGLQIGGHSSAAVPAELSSWRQLEQQRAGRLSALIRVS